MGTKSSSNVLVEQLSTLLSPGKDLREVDFHTVEFSLHHFHLNRERRTWLQDLWMLRRWRFQRLSPPCTPD